MRSPSSRGRSAPGGRNSPPNTRRRSTPDSVKCSPATATNNRGPPMQVTTDSDTDHLDSILRENGTPDIGALWEIAAHYEWADRERAVASISNWLGEPGSVRLLDCACGSGFPAIDLAALGHDVTCSDGSPRMLELFHRNAAERGVAVPASLARWEELTDHHGPASFDV